MAIGSHGYNHHWMNYMSFIEQKSDIRASLKFLKTLGISLENWIMCYPYGAYNETLIELVKKLGCGLGFTTQNTLANLNTHNPFCLPRLDTNKILELQY